MKSKIDKKNQNFTKKRKKSMLIYKIRVPKWFHLNNFNVIFSGYMTIFVECVKFVLYFYF